MTVQSGATGISAYPRGRSSSVTNSIFYDFTGTSTHAIDYFTASDYNAFYGNTSNYGPDMSAGAHDKTTVDPVGTGSIKYITRIESGSPLKGAGQGGSDIGANINTLIGTPGTLWGDTGYNVDTGVSMWPFPNEALIRTQMAAYNGYSINGARGFCAGTTTLTKYIWQYLGNTIPSNIYGGGNPPTATAQASPTSGQTPLTVTFTGTGTSSGGTISSYSWNFGDGGTSTQQNPSHVYLSAGNFNAVLTVTDNSGNTGTASIDISATSVTPTYAISGYITDSGGTAINGITVSLSGSVSGSTTTSVNGYYQFPGLLQGGSYTITPSNSSWSFIPISISTGSLTANLSNPNFVGTAVVTSGNTYYLSPTGSDSANGSSAAPWATLVKAMSTMKGGDTLIVNDGTYTGTSNAITHNGTYPPYGSASAYTTIKAAHDGMAIFDGQGTTNLFHYDANSQNDAYWLFQGIVWCHNPTGNAFFDWITHVKFIRCGAYDCGDGDNQNFAGGRSSSYCLFENCWAYGSGRYKFMFYLSDHCIIRSCVGRGDRMNAVEPMANFAIYSSSACEVQNCIAIDTDQTAMYSADEYDGGFLVPATSVSAWNINFTNCINLNNTSGGVNTDQNAIAYNIHFLNCVLWNNSEPEDTSGICRIKGTGTTFVNCTFGALSLGSSGLTAVSAYPGGRNCSITNSIIYDVTGTSSHAIDYFASSDYNAFYENTGNYGPNMTAGAHDKTTVDPIGTGSIKYMTRIESGSPLKGAGQGGADIGANLTDLIGTPGTLWGDPGYNVDTGVPMWPFPSEALIRSQMAAYNGYSINGARGFCAGTTTLTKYIWQYLGNTIPANIYGGGTPPTATVLASPTSGQMPLTVNFTGTGTATGGTIASYSWNFGDGGNSTLQNPSHVYLSSGSFSAVLTVTDSNNNTGAASAVINVTPAYTISGYITASGGAAISSVTVSLSGSLSGSTSTAVNGYYQFASLAPGGGYAVTPSNPGYTFAPASISTSSLTASLGNQNFVGTSTITYYVGGYIHDNLGSAMNGVAVALTGNTTGSVLSAADGSYQFSNLTNSKNYTVMPSKPGYVFVPVSISTASLSANYSNQNFVGTSTITYYIGGYINDNYGAAMSGASVALTGNTTGSVLSAVDGSYQFSNLANIKNYTITPSKPGYIFVPISLSTTSLTANLSGQSFVGSSTATYYMAGYVHDNFGSAMNGATVALTGNSTGFVLSAAERFIPICEPCEQQELHANSRKARLRFCAGINKHWIAYG